MRPPAAGPAPARPRSAAGPARPWRTGPAAPRPARRARRPRTGPASASSMPSATRWYASWACSPARRETHVPAPPARRVGPGHRVTFPFQQAHGHAGRLPGHPGPAGHVPLRDPAALSTRSTLALTGRDSAVRAAPSALELRRGNSSAPGTAGWAGPRRPRGAPARPQAVPGQARAGRPRDRQERRHLVAGRPGDRPQGPGELVDHGGAGPFSPAFPDQLASGAQISWAWRPRRWAGRPRPRAAGLARRRRPRSRRNPTAPGPRGW